MLDCEYWMKEFDKRFSVGDVVKHFKHDLTGPCDIPSMYLYEIVGTGLYTEGVLCVIYKPLYPNEYEFFARPIEEFVSKVNKEKHPDAKQEYRFEKVR